MPMLDPIATHNRRTRWAITGLEAGALLFIAGLAALYLNPFWHFDDGGFLNWKLHWWNAAGGIRTARGLSDWGATDVNLPEDGYAGLPSIDGQRRDSIVFRCAEPYNSRLKMERVQYGCHQPSSAAPDQADYCRTENVLRVGLSRLSRCKERNPSLPAK
jgi:hypothetical protein